MAQVITRYFESADQAYTAKRTLQFERFPPADLKIFTDPDGVVKALTEAHVDEAAAKAYAERLKSGGAVFLANATYKPLGAAKLTRQVTADIGAADMGDLVEEVYVKDTPGQAVSVFTDHPLILTRRKDRSPAGYYMADWPLPLISRRKPADEFLFPRHARMAAFPIPLISRHKPSDRFAFPRHARMANWPIPLTIRWTPADRFAFPRHARMANWPIPLISRRKPYSGTLIGRHTRMANWPFPHLINGKTGTNSIIPGHPHQANFPFPLLSDRKPVDAFAFPRHARMANFPIPLISKRKPADKFAFPRHKRMADILLPLVVKNAESTGGARGFSFSRMIGLPTIKRR